MTTRNDIERVLWKACDSFRGKIDSSRYKDYILSMLFVKYLSDVTLERRALYMEQYDGDERRVERAMSRERFSLDRESTFDYLYENRTDTEIGQKINVALSHIEDHNSGKLRNVFRAIIYLPALVAPVIMGTMYYFIFQYQQGALNTIMTGLGFEKVAWFNNPAVSVAIITIVNSIQFVGVSMIIYLAGLQTLDQSVMEAASLDGASGWKKFWNITLPMLQPAFTTSVVLNLIGGLKLFDIIKVLTNGGPGYATNSISTYISSMYFDAQNAGYASALGVFLFILIAIITYLLNTGLAKLNWEA
jgi:ABC-type polysaccharide transport system permease subunit